LAVSGGLSNMADMASSSVAGRMRRNSSTTMP
jgi:hypothetical protein